MHLTSIHGIFLLGEYFAKCVQKCIRNTEEGTQTEVVQDQEVEKDVRGKK